MKSGMQIRNSKNTKTNTVFFVMNHIVGVVDRGKFSVRLRSGDYYLIIFPKLF